MFTRIRRMLAERLGLHRLDSAVNYILIKDLNLQSRPASGGNGNDALREAFLSLFNVLNPTVFCDIGANDGSASLAVREIAPDCAIYAFEANPQIYAHVTNLP
jgi:precorrin-6B methylase 2